MTTRACLGAIGVLSAFAALTLGRVGGGPRPPARAPRPVVIIVGATPSHPVIAGPLATSRAFLAAYEQFIYGRLAPAGLPDVSPYIRHQLAGQRPDPPAAVVAAADPRLESLRLASPGRASPQSTIAVLADGPATYTIRIELERRRAGWTITGLAEAG